MSPVSPEPPTSSSTAGHGSRRRPAVLVTGAAGEVGHGLIMALADEGRADIVALDVRELEPEMRTRCRETHVGDICDAALLGRLLAMYKITEIFHLAALLSTRAEFTPETAHEVNVGGTLNLLRLGSEQARSHGEVVRFVLPSSIAAYGLPDLETKAAAGRVGEGDYLMPMTMYGCNKLYCEHLGRYYARHYRQLAEDQFSGEGGAAGIDFRCLRYPGLISADTVPSGGTSDFAPEMIHAAASGAPYACFVRETTRIPFMTMPDAIQATLALARADGRTLTRPVYNVTAFNPSAGDVAALVQDAFAGAEITFEPDEARQRIVDSWPEDVDDSAARKDWGFDPNHGLEEAFSAYLIPRIRARYAGTATSQV